MTTKADVRTESTYIRELLRQVEQTLKGDLQDPEEAEQLANELMAASCVFSSWVNEQRSN